MIRFIVAIDEDRGLADDEGIPWIGKIPGDSEYYKAKVNDGSPIVVGYGLYKELTAPYEGGTNYVATRNVTEPLLDGFVPIADAHKFIEDAKNNQQDVWNLGGAGLYASTFDLADELYITQLEGTYGCTKFFPEYKETFELKEEADPITENGITYRFQIWTKKAE